MQSNTKLLKLVSQLEIQSKQKVWVFQKIVTISIFALFLGFICGNIFGTFLEFFRHFFKWDGFIIFLTILLIEFINYLTFTKIKNKKKQKQNNRLKLKQPLVFKRVIQKIDKQDFVKIINFYKIGLLLGFFIDAFKVGS